MDPKILYVNIISKKSIGVFKILKHKALTAKDLDIPMDILVINPEDSYKKDNITFLKVGYSSYKFKIFAPNVLLEYLNKHINNYDILLLRYPLVESPYLLKVLKNFKGIIVSEHHTHEFSELLSTGRKIDKIRAIWDYLIKPYYFKYIKGLVAVTSEIAKFQKKYIKKYIPSCVVSNGIRVKDINYTGYTKFNGKYIKCLILTSECQPWQGVDIIINSLRKWKKLRVELYIIGKLSEQIKKILATLDNPKVKIFNYNNLSEEKLQILLKSTNFAFSSLALYRKGLQEACPLKTREYLARGIPIVYSYKDTDLNGDEPFALRIDTNNNYLDWDQIIEFLKTVPEGNEIREWAKKNVDLSLKLSKLYSFLKGLYS